MVLDDPRPGDEAGLVETNKTAWMTVCGPFLSKELGSKKWLGGDTFSILDILVGYSLVTVLEFRGWDSDELANLKQLYFRIARRESFKKACGQFPKGWQYT